MRYSQNCVENTVTYNEITGLHVVCVSWCTVTQSLVGVQIIVMSCLSVCLSARFLSVHLHISGKYRSELDPLSKHITRFSSDGIAVH